MTQLSDRLLTEKYRPKSFDELILEKKETLLNYLKNLKAIPSFIFYSTKPGTGKTSCAKVIANTINCDILIINSSDERGIDTIRDKIKYYVRSVSSNPETKRCVFLDEADGMTRQAQDSLRNLMETYSDNAFFIFSCNDISKIIEPIRSRCVSISFERPDKTQILGKLMDIKNEERLNGDVRKLIDYYYPDIRSMIMKLQSPNEIEECELEKFYEAVEKRDIDYIYEKVYSKQFDIMVFNKWLFKKVFDNWKEYGLEIASKVAEYLADTEKNWNLGVNLEIIFINNILKIANVLHK